MYSRVKMFGTDARVFTLASAGAANIAVSFFSGFYTITHSLVINIVATAAAYSSVSRVTLTGSIMPDSGKVSYFSFSIKAKTFFT